MAEGADADTLARINELADEEHQLREREAAGEATDEDRERIQQIELMLDQCWDLLRQRRARREAGGDPGEAQPRSVNTVESYRQ